MTFWFGVLATLAVLAVACAAAQVGFYLLALQTAQEEQNGWHRRIAGRVLKDAEADFRSQDPSVPLDDGFDMTRDGSGDA